MGEQEWEPENCNSCLQFQNNLVTLSPEMQKQSRKILKNVLRKMKKAAKTSSWHFKQKRSEFLKNIESNTTSIDTRSEPSTPRSDTVQDNIVTQYTSSGSMSNRSDIAQDDLLDENNTIHEDNSNAQPDTEPTFGLSQLVQAFKPLFEDMTIQLGRALHAGPVSTVSRSTSPDVHRDTLQQKSLIHNYEPERPPFFTEFGHFWFYLTHQHRLEGHKVWLNNELKEFIRHPSKPDAIRTIEDTVHDSPYMTSYQAHETLISFFGADKVASDKLGPHNRSFRLPLDEDSGLAHALRILHSCTPTALFTIHTGDKKSIASAYTPSAFEAASVINFTSGWNLTTNSDYPKWAKNEVINLKQVSEALRLKWMVYVPPKIMQAEKCARNILVEHISGLAMLNRNIKEAEGPRQASGLQATAKQFLPILKDLTIKWVQAKYEVRRVALQNPTSALADRLLLSDVWASTLFQQSEIDAIRSRLPT